MIGKTLFFILMPFVALLFAQTVQAEGCLYNWTPLNVIGSMGVSYNSSQLALTGGAYTTQNIGWINKVQKNITIDTTNGFMQVLYDGYYRVSMHLSFTRQQNADDIHGGISINCKPPAGDVEWNSYTNDPSGFGAIVGMFALHAGDKISIKIENETASRYIIPVHMKFIVTRYGDL